MDNCGCCSVQLLDFLGDWYENTHQTRVPFQGVPITGREKKGHWEPSNSGPVVAGMSKESALAMASGRALLARNVIELMP